MSYTHLQSSISRPSARPSRAVRPARAPLARAPETLAAQIEAWHRYETPEQLLTLCNVIQDILGTFGAQWRGPAAGTGARFDINGLASDLSVAPERIRRAIYEMQLHGMVTIDWDGATPAGVAYDKRTPGWAATEASGVYVGAPREEGQS